MPLIAAEAKFDARKSVGLFSVNDVLVNSCGNE